MTGYQFTSVGEGFEDDNRIDIDLAELKIDYNLNRMDDEDYSIISEQIKERREVGAVS